MTLQELIDATPELAALGQDYPAIAEWLNHEPTIPNPDAQGQVMVSVPITMESLLGVLTREEKASILSLPSFSVYLSDSYKNQSVTESAIDSVANAFNAIATGEMPFLAAVRYLVEGGQTGTLAALTTILVQRLHLSPETAIAISSEIDKTATVPDPSWQPLLKQPPRYEQLGLTERVTPEFVQGELN
jgi:hypothetical protein